MSVQTGGQRLRRLATRRPGPLGYALLPLTWIVLGALMVAYAVVILALAFAAVLVATLRLFLIPPVQLLGRLHSPARPRPTPE